jgi:hypothetical protein
MGGLDEVWIYKPDVAGVGIAGGGGGAVGDGGGDHRRGCGVASDGISNGNF